MTPPDVDMWHHIYFFLKIILIYIKIWVITMVDKSHLAKSHLCVGKSHLYIRKSHLYM